MKYIIGEVQSEVLKKIIEEDINEVDNEKIISIIKDLNYNIFSTSIFNDTYNYMKSGNLFRQVINEINKID